MQDLDTYNRFRNSFMAKAGDEGGEPKKDDGHPFHVDRKTRAAVHKALKVAHFHTFETAKDTDYESAKGRHAAIVSLAEPDDEKKATEK
jgi:hypothetical protein